MCLEQSYVFYYIEIMDALNMFYMFVVIYIKKPTDYISEFSLLRNLTTISIHQKVTNTKEDRILRPLSKERRKSYANSGYEVQNFKKTGPNINDSDTNLELSSGYKDYMDEDPIFNDISQNAPEVPRYSQKSIGIESKSSYMGSSIASQE